MNVFLKALFFGNQPVVLVDQNNVAITQSNPLPTQFSAGDVELLRQILAELKGIRLAVATIASDGGRSRLTDFDPEQNPDLQPRQ